MSYGAYVTVHTFNRTAAPQGMWQTSPADSFYLCRPYNNDECILILSSIPHILDQMSKTCGSGTPVANYPLTYLVDSQHESLIPSDSAHHYRTVARSARHTASLNSD